MSVLLSGLLLTVTGSADCTLTLFLKTMEVVDKEEVCERCARDCSDGRCIENGVCEDDFWTYTSEDDCDGDWCQDCPAPAREQECTPCFEACMARPDKTDCFYECPTPVDAACSAKEMYKMQGNSADADVTKLEGFTVDNLLGPYKLSDTCHRCQETCFKKVDFMAVVQKGLKINDMDPTDVVEAGFAWLLEFTARALIFSACSRCCGGMDPKDSPEIAAVLTSQPTCEENFSTVNFQDGTDSAAKDSGLSTGVIIGIVVGVLVLLMLVCVAIRFCMNSKQATEVEGEKTAT